MVVVIRDDPNDPRIVFHIADPPERLHMNSFARFENKPNADPIDDLLVEFQPEDLVDEP